MENVAELAATLGNKMEELAAKFGPPTVELARSAASVEAWQQLYVNIAWGVILAGLAYALYRSFRYCKADLVKYDAWRNRDRDGYLPECEKPKLDDDWAAIGMISSAVLGVIAAALSLIAIMDAFSPWTLGQIVNPDLVIVRKILDL